MSQTGKHIRRYFAAGLLVWLPIWVTVIVIKFIVDLLDGVFKLLPYKYQPDQLLGIHIPGMGLIFTIIILFATGILVTNFIGNKIVMLWDKLVDRIPLIRSIHSAVKQVLSALFHPHGKSFRKVLLVQYPRLGIWSVAFQTAEQFHRKPMDEEVVTAFIPTTPNPTSGFLLIVPKKDVIELDISIEQALRMIISLGVVMPDEKPEVTSVDTKEQSNKK